MVNLATFRRCIELPEEMAVKGGAKWQRCQFHLAQNAIHHAPSQAIRKRIGAELREVRNAGSLPKAEIALADLVTAYHDTAPKLAEWLEKTYPRASLYSPCQSTTSAACSPRTRSSAVQQELKRRTVKVRVFPGEDALLRLVSAVLVEIDEKWASETKAYIKWECQDA